jgi:cytokinin dehydrogenase
LTWTPSRTRFVAFTTDSSDEALAAVAEDFGHVRRGTARGVVRPTSVAEVSEVVRAAASAGSALTVRGTGHSAGGQAVPHDSTVLDLTRVNAVGRIDIEAGTVVCEGGTTLRQLVEAVLPLGFLPRPLTNLLDLSVGGVLGIGGGVGPSSHLFGALASNVIKMRVVTADGTLHECSPTVETDLFEAVLGGLGACGVIVAARLRLRRARSRVRTFYLLYDDHERWIADQRLIADAGAEAIEGSCSALPQGLRGTGGRRSAFVHWFFPLHVAMEFDDAEPELPGDVNPYRILAVEDDDIGSFPGRHDARFETMRRIGAWSRAHPYVSAFIDRNALAEVLPAVLDALPLSLGDGYRGGFLFDRTDAPPLLALPSSNDVTFFSIMYPQILPELLTAALEAHEAIGELLIQAGGKRYAADWMGEMDEGRWRARLGDRYETWMKARRAYDPGGVFTSKLLSDGH